MQNFNNGAFLLYVTWRDSKEAQNGKEPWSLEQLLKDWNSEPQWVRERYVTLAIIENARKMA